MKRKRSFLKTVSLILIGTFCLSEVSYSAPPSEGLAILGFPKSFDLSQDPTRFEAPLDFSTLKEIHQGTNGTFIIHIQDAHSNLSGQENLANALDAIMSKYGVSLVLSEGGADDCSLTSIKKIAPPEVWKRLAKSYLIQGKITGEEYLNLISDHPMKIMGLEDINLYFKSVRNYARLADKRQEILEYLKTIDNALSKVKHKLYPQELLVYEDQKKDQDASPDNAHFKKLLELAREKNIDIFEFPNVVKLVELELKEKLIDFNLANLEQAALVEDISKRGGAEDLKGFLTKINQMKNKKVSQYAFFQNTFRIAEENGILLTQHPNLIRYEEYLKDFSELDLDELLDELTKADDKVYITLLKSQDEKLIRSIDRFLGLLHTAYNIQMSTKEFDLFKANEPDFGTMPYLAFINQKLSELGYFEDLIPYKNILEEGKESLEAFYDSVSKRDFEFMKNTEKVLNAENQKVAVLVTGGYHTSHLKKLFQEKGYSYAVLTPIVTAETNQQKYESQLLSPIRPEIKKVEIVQGETRHDKSLSLLEKDLIKKKTDGVRQALLRAWAANPPITLAPDERQILLIAQRFMRNNFEAFLRDALRSEGINDPDEIDKRMKEILKELLEELISRTKRLNLEHPSLSAKKIGARLATNTDVGKLYDEEFDRDGVNQTRHGPVVLDELWRATRISDDLRTRNPKLYAERIEIRSRLMRALPKPTGRPLRVLSVGAGRGDIEAEILNLRPDLTIVAVDISQNNVDRMKSHPQLASFLGEGRFEAIKGDAHLLSQIFPNSSFDGVLFIHSLGYLRESEALLEASKVAKSDAKFLITEVPREDSTPQSIEATGAEPPTDQEILTALAQAGLKTATLKVEKISVDYQFTYGANHRSASVHGDMNWVEAVKSNPAVSTKEKIDVIRFSDQFGARLAQEEARTEDIPTIQASPDFRTTLAKAYNAKRGSLLGLIYNFLVTGISRYTSVGFSVDKETGKVYADLYSAKGVVIKTFKKEARIDITDEITKPEAKPALTESSRVLLKKVSPVTEAVTITLRNMRLGEREIYSIARLRDRTQPIDLKGTVLIVKTFTQAEFDAMTSETKTLIKAEALRVQSKFKRGKVLYQVNVIDNNGVPQRNGEIFEVIQNIPAGTKVMYQGSLPKSFLQSLGRQNQDLPQNQRIGVIMTDSRLNPDKDFPFNIIPDIPADLSAIMIAFPDVFDPELVRGYIGRYTGSPVRDKEDLNDLREVPPHVTLELYERKGLIIRRIAALSLKQILEAAKMVTQAIGASA